MITAGHTHVTIPTFEVGRLRLRAPTASDLDAFAAFCASERSKGVGGPFDRAQAFDSLCKLVGHWHLRGYGRWLVADRDSDLALGVVGLLYPDDWPEPEIAWTVFEEAEGTGVAFEAAEFARRYAYDVMDWQTVISCTLPDNARSIALAKRLGATKDTDFVHPTYGPMNVWRHPGPEALQ